ncbi:MAG: T9SS type A sorting domain-containing protein [Bacteroidota bacterium]|nr:T9SS type A sorting domain-containing protein [Bacteroidota bacterium]
MPERFMLSFSLVSINNYMTDHQMKVWYRNDQLFIKSDLSKAFQLMLFDCKGQLIGRRHFTGKGIMNYNIDLPAGIYIARIYSDSQVKSIKFFSK